MDDRTRTKTVKHALQLFEVGHPVSDIKAFLPSLFPKQNKTNIEMIIEKSIEMCSSLMKATDEAGGSGWSIDILSKMTVIELISILGINNVRFAYKDNSKHKLKEIEIFAKDMVNEFEEELEDHPDNSMAAFAINIYKEIIEKVKE